MSSTINASTASGGGVITSADASGVLALQTAGVTGLTIDASQNVTTSANLTYTGTLTGSTGVLNIGSGQVYKDASGNVGIGTSSPAYKLDIQGNAAGQFWASIKNTNAGASSIGGWFFGNDTYSDVGGVFAGSSGGGGFGGANSMNIGSWKSAPLAMFTNNTERMRIDSSGNVLVGTTSALGKMTISWPSASQQGMTLKATDSTFAGSPVVFYNSAGGLSGFIGQTTSTVSYNSSSDYRLKENVLPMVGALTTIAQLKPVTYNWKVDGSNGQGFIAHELAEVVPDCVTGEKDAVDAEGNPQYQGIDTSFLVATLTSAIQELKAIIDTQQEQIDKLGVK